ncbi:MULTISPECIES: transposase domain-containing protein [unclassified Cellvibrio]|nr:transposase domain-containing protein [Cellvibrio sp. KY-GH-1]
MYEPSARGNNLNPVKYTEHLLTEIPKHTEDDRLEDLIPWTVKLNAD